MNITVPFMTTPHQWLSGSALKAGIREVPDSIHIRACRPTRWSFRGLL